MLLPGASLVLVYGTCQAPQSSFHFAFSELVPLVYLSYLVGKEGVEPPRLAALDPKSSVSASFTTFPLVGVVGFEPTITRTQTACLARLDHTPSPLNWSRLVYGATPDSHTVVCYNRHGFFWWAGEDLNLRSTRRRVYSPPSLTTRAPTHKYDCLSLVWAAIELAAFRRLKGLTWWRRILAAKTGKTHNA